MLRDALADAQLDPTTIDYVRPTAPAHPSATRSRRRPWPRLCRGRPADRPLHIGSVKSNIGHLEAAAGAAGLIKLALALQHRSDPGQPALPVTQPGDRFCVRGPEGANRWRPLAAAGAEPPAGGVSSFGFGGTNCHVILQAAPPTETVTARPVFVFAGNGGNWAGMARALLAEPVFAGTLAECDTILASLSYPTPVASVLDDAQVTGVALGQPALCAFQIALAALLESIGVTPAAVIGHSVGEAAAACVAGALDAGDGVAARGRTQPTAGNRCRARRHGTGRDVRRGAATLAASGRRDCRRKRAARDASRRHA